MGRHDDPFDDFDLPVGKFLGVGLVIGILYWAAIAAIILGGLKIAGVI